MKVMDEEILKKQEFNYDDNLELIQKARAGDKDCLDKLIQLNLPLVSAVSKKFLNRGYEYEDIFQIGSMGLVKAVNNFDERFNVKFSTYAVPMIMGEIKRFLRDDGIIKVSRSVKNVARKLHYDKEALSKKLDRDPTIEELSQYSGVSTEEIIFALESANGMQYLYDTIHQDDGSPVLLIDKLSENFEEDNEIVDKLALKEALSNLDNKSRQIIMLRYFKDKTQVQVAKMLGISQVQVSRIEKKVLKLMKERLSG
ncbi:RNA polymerase sigma-F factor [Clostridiales bacterium oral taxon 876 str. F0540]|nr:RNA polymerase sigma-F factor [Clostridiales bacterium oral taxon 876 str. F0540]